MLSAWFACVCLDASPARTASYLGVLDILDDPASPLALARAALGELRHMDIWMRIHAFPYVCRWARRDTAERGDVVEAQRYLLDLKTLLPEELEGSFSDLYQFVLHPRTPAKAAQRVRAWAAAARRVVPPRGANAAPYLDLPDELAAVIVLALEAQALSERPGEPPAGDTDDEYELELLLKQALAGERGRLPLLLALEIQRLRGSFDGVKPAAVLAGVPKSETLASPDLLEFVVRSQFTGKPVADVVAESRSFAVLQTFLDDPLGIPSLAVVERLGLRGTAEQLPTTAMVLWTGALWEFAAASDPDACARVFADIWGPPRPPAGERDNASSTGRGSKGPARALLTLREPPRRGQQPRKRSVEATIDPTWSTYSPWLDLGPDPRNKSPIYYPAHSAPLPVYRLVAAVIAALRCVTKVDAADDRAAIIALFVHTWTVLELHHAWLPQKLEDDVRPGLPDLRRPLRGLAYYAFQQIRRLGRGECARPSPEEFVRQLDEADEDDPEPLQQFRQEVVPSTLVRWLQDAYPQAVPGQQAVRWLSLVPGVVREYRRRCVETKRHRDGRTAEAELLRRFVLGLKSRVDTGFDWWLGGGKVILHRDLLLSPEVPHRRWRELDDGRLEKAGPLVRAIERVATHTESDPPLSDDERSEWRVLLTSGLAPQKLERYIRLRLIEFMDCRAIRDDVEAQLDIVLFLLECGSPFEQHRLFLRIFPDSDAGWTASSTAAAQLRSRVLEPLLRARRALDSVGDELAVRDPWRVHNQSIRHQLFTDVLERIAWFAAGSELARELARLLGSEPGPASPLEGDLELAAGSRSLRLEHQRELPAHRIDGVVVNLNAGRGHARAADIDDQACVDLLAHPPEARRELLSERRAKGRPILAQVVGLRQDRGRDRYRLAAGLDRCLEHSHPAGRLPHEVGDWVSVWLSPDGALEVDRGSWLERPPRRHAPGSTARAWFRSDRDEGIGLGVEGDPSPRWDRQIWAPSAIHRLTDGQREREITALRGRDDAWYPEELELVQLALEGRVWALVWVGHGRDSRASGRMTFGVRPGRSVTLPAEVWEPAALVRLEAEVARCDELNDNGGARGLIVAVRIARVLDGQCSRLRVVLCEPGDPELPEKGRLSAPFDDCNVRWAAQFLRQDRVIARADREGFWWVEAAPELHAKGFPQWIAVLEGSSGGKVREPTWRGATAEVGVQRWDADGQRRARVVCVSLRMNELRVPPRERQAFLKSCSQLGRRHPLVVASVKYQLSTADVLCLTPARLAVKVEGDSLCLGPLEGERMFTDETLEGRRFEVRKADEQVMRTVALAPEEAAELPPEVQAGGRGEALVFKAPQEEGEHWCEVLWRDLGDSLARLTLPARTDLPRIHPGMWIKALLRDGRWTLQIERRQIVSRALWRVVPAPPDGTTVTIVGEGRWDGKVGWFAEVRPGELCVLPKAPGLRLFARGELGRLDEAPEPSLVGDNLAGRFAWDGPDGLRICQAWVSCGSQLWLGQCYDGAPREQLRVTGARLDLRRVVIDGEEWFDVHRSFDLEPASERVERPRKRDRVAHEEFRRRWEAYHKAPRTLLATRIGDEVELHHLAVPHRKDDWTRRLPLPAECGPWMTWGEDAPCQVRLAQDGEGRWFASCRLVPPLDPDEFRARHYPDAAPEQTIELRERLIYVHREEGGEGEGFHVFEWAPGSVLRVPEPRLRFDGDPFARVTPVVFYGDEVRDLRFIVESERTGGEATEERREWTSIDILGARLSISEASSLYSQARQLQMLHVLKATRRGSELVVLSVLGFRERDEEEFKEFKRSRAVLDEQSAARLHARLVRTGASEAILLGRLDTRRFRESLGQEVVYEHVRLDFAAGEAAALRPGGRKSARPEATDPESFDSGDLVFMITEKIEEKTNDYALLLRPIPGMHAEDIGEKFRRPLHLLRRDFSAREDALERLFRVHGERGFAGRWIPVRLRDGEPIHSTLINAGSPANRRLPVRDFSVLRSRVAASERPVFGVVLERTLVDEQFRGLLLELRPTVYVRLTPNQASGPLERFSSGDVLRITAAEGPLLRVDDASFAETRYIQGRRPAVALPMNKLFLGNRRDGDPTSRAFWAADLFTIGGLPSLKASLRRAADGHDPAEGYALMRLKHPKVVDVERVGGRFQVTPSRRYGRGRIEIDRERRTVSAVQEIAGECVREDIAWRGLSFLDGTIDEIEPHLRRRWTYHDRRTGHWNEHGEPEVSDIGATTAFHGPLFFEHVRGKPTLRYSEQSFLRHGFPVGELVRALEQADGPLWFPVAAPSEGRAVWIEVGPGRLAELPGALVVVRTDAGEHSLDGFAWDTCAPGDRVLLALAREQQTVEAGLDVDRVVLLDYRPGPRGAFAERMLLPVGEPFVEGGGVRLGAGTYQLVIPLPKPCDVRVVGLAADNALARGEVEPEEGDGVLLVVDGDSRLRAAGLEDWQVLVDRSQPQRTGDDDPIWDALVYLVDGKPSWSPRAHSVVAAAGGAVPMTIGWVEREKKWLGLSRTHQRRAQAHARAGTCWAVVVGRLDQRVILRAGGALLALPLRSVVAGVRESVADSVVTSLAEARERVWVRWTPEGPRTGLGDQGHLECIVRPLATAVAEAKQDRRPASGLVCRVERSEDLCWLPSSAVAWTELDVAELSALFLRKSLLVRRDRGDVSVTRTTQAEKELRELTVGTELAVHVVRAVEPSAPGGVRRLLVRAPASGVVFLCNAQRSQARRGAVLRAVIADRSLRAPCSLIATPIEEHGIRLDLTGAVDELLATDQRKRPAYEAYVAAVERARADALPEPLASVPTESHELMCALTEAFHCNHRSPWWAIRLAEAWAKLAERAQELPLQPTLGAILMLDEYSHWDPARLAAQLRSSHMSREDLLEWQREWRVKAMALLRSTVARARRSLHVEILSRYWLTTADRTRSSGLWRRLQALGSRIAALRTGADPASGRDVMAEIRGFVRAATLQGDRYLLAVAGALSASIGDASALPLVCAHAEVFRQFIVTAAPSHGSARLDEVQIEILRQMANAHESDLVLLDPIEVNDDANPTRYGARGRLS